MLIKDKVIKQGKFLLEISYITDKGGRPVNEDLAAVEHKGDNILLSVADGLGAHGGGDTASLVATDTVKKMYMELTKPNSKNIYKIFRCADNAVVLKHTNDVKMKTTLACVFCQKKHIYGSHLGDTRIYTFKNNKMTYVSEDHSAAFEETIENKKALFKIGISKKDIFKSTIKKEISNKSILNQSMLNKAILADIRKNPNRHILSAALGVGRIRTPGYLKERLCNGLSVLICSDGFWEYVNEDEMTYTLKEAKSSHMWLEEMMKLHKEKAVKYNDNYSAICLRIINYEKGGDDYAI